MSTPYQFFKRLSSAGWIGRKERKNGQYAQRKMKKDKEIEDGKIEFSELQNQMPEPCCGDCEVCRGSVYTY